MEDSLSAGMLLARRYRLIDPIGAGGMSVIWRARDEVLDRIVALKVLAPELAADQRLRDLVREEARNAAQLVHPHVTAVHDYGEMIAPDGTVTAFVVMELLTGETLDRKLTAGALPWRDALRICAQVAEALAAAHRIGVVHRDITPGNIMLTEGGVKVLDFGIATRVGAPDEDDDGDTFGTPAYVAPERLDGTPTLPATDTYALGVLLFETLTGRVPFPAVTWDDLAKVPRHGVPPAPTGAPDLPPEVAQLCQRCLSRSPLDRPTAHQVAETLNTHLSPRPVLVPVSAMGQVSPAARRTEASPRSYLPGTASTRTTPDTTPRRRDANWVRMVTAVAAAVVVIATASVVAMALRTSARNSPDTDAAGPTTPAPATSSKGPDLPLIAPKPSPSPSTTSTTASPTGAPAPTVGETITAISQIIDDGLAADEIRADAATDLQNVVKNLRSAINQGTVDLASEAAQLQAKVDTRRREGAITGDTADQLDSQVSRLATARL
jgi:eukaryotic-like serine/threonine-protein kinase